MGISGYESWFVSARDPESGRALWIRHTRLRRGQAPESAALWCTVVDRGSGERPTVVKQVFDAFPPAAVADPGRFRGEAVMAGQDVRWELAITGGQPAVRPMRPEVLYRAPLPRTKLETPAPDGLVTGVLDVNGRRVDVVEWRGTVGHNWGTGHADSWVWLHAAGLDAAGQGWLELVLAKIRIGPARSPWTALGKLSLGGRLVPLGGLGRRPRVTAGPARLTAQVPSPQARLDVTVTASDRDRVTVAYTDPSGGTRAVSHAALARAELAWHRHGESDLTMSSDHTAYEYGTSQLIPGTTLRPLPEG
ncbi:MAG TPA: hypothetical protein VGS19_18690 [Streptosporangiaceae bacterium]|nr:hypothetical protein [Streptosporangiaceae bacterium]